MSASIPSVPLDKDEVAFPCGLIAKSYFTDTFKLFKGVKEVPINRENIAWKSDKDNKFKNYDLTK